MESDEKDLGGSLPLRVATILRMDGIECSRGQAQLTSISNGKVLWQKVQEKKSVITDQIVQRGIVA